jgi:hypothetical protein
MSARRSPVEQDARELAGAALKGAWRRRRNDATAADVFHDAMRAREQSTTWAVQRGDMPAARRQARAAQLLEESLDRMTARWKRDTAAELAKIGLVAGARVVAVRAGFGRNAPPVGTVVTLDEAPTSHYIFGTDDDGHRWIVNSGDVEVVPDALAVEAPEPHDDEHGGDEPPEPPLGDRIIASGLLSDSAAFTLAGVAYEAEWEGRDPDQAVQELMSAWDAGEASA